MDNEMTLTFLAISENEALARVAITGFIAQLDPTIDELSEFKTVVSEAVSMPLFTVMKKMEKVSLQFMQSVRMIL